jgi:DNA-binding NarL/FixJ family response regulator
MPKIKVILADDHQIVRQGMRALLNAQPDIEVIGEAIDGYELVDLVGKLSPQVVITDIAMPNLNGIEAAAQIRKRHPGTQVIILSMYSAPPYIIRALRSGALGYLLKDDDFKDVIKAIHLVAQGHRFLSTQVSDQVFDLFLGGNSNIFNEEIKLTEREREVLQLIAEGNTSPQIAEKLGIGVRTVETHRANLKAKLNLSTNADIVRYAVQQGFVTPKE